MMVAFCMRSKPEPITLIFLPPLKELHTNVVVRTQTMENTRFSTLYKPGLLVFSAASESTVKSLNLNRTEMGTYSIGVLKLEH